MKNTPLLERDMTPQCAELRYDDPCVKVVVGDANKGPTFADINAICNQFDEGIDDGLIYNNPEFEKPLKMVDFCRSRASGQDS